MFNAKQNISLSNPFFFFVDLFGGNFYRFDCLAPPAAFELLASFVLSNLVDCMLKPY